MIDLSWRLVYTISLFLITILTLIQKVVVFFFIKFQDKTSLPITRLVLPLQVVLTKHSIFNRYQFFLQIKRDILQGRLPITFDEAAELFAFAVQGKNSWCKNFFTPITILCNTCNRKMISSPFCSCFQLNFEIMTQDTAVRVMSLNFALSPIKLRN